MYKREASAFRQISVPNIHMCVGVTDARCDYACSWLVQHHENDSFYLIGQIISVPLSGDSPHIKDYQHRVEFRETASLSESTGKALKIGCQYEILSMEVLLPKNV